ncbi:MAG: beta-N-acetylhexosaminidase [Aggregatilineales bacterium]
MLSLEDKIGQMFMIGFHGLEPPHWVLDMLANGQIGGVVLFARNVANPEQLARLTKSCHDAAKHPILIAIDQEGGSVTRLYEKDGFTESPGAMVLGAINSEEIAQEVAALLASEMRTLGINWDLAPVVDITHNINNPSVGTRSLGTNKKLVSKLAAAQIFGFQGESVAASAKHFPGLGNTSVDTHEALAVIDDTLETLWERDLVPFRVAVKSRISTVMMTHVKFSQIDPEHPATLSRPVIEDLLRDEIGFQGVTCTDCMEMKAVSDHYGSEESAVLAAIAGQDIILFSHSFNTDSGLYPRIYDTLLEAAKSGRIPMERIDESNIRIARLKARYAITSKPAIDHVGASDRIETMNETARLGLVQVHDNAGLLPLSANDSRKIVLIEFASHLDSGIMEAGGVTAFTEIISTQMPNLESMSLKAAKNPTETIQAALALAKSADIVILATRNAHLNPEELEISQQILSTAGQVILLCLRNPYDILVLENVGTALCTCGDSRPSMRAAVQALLGQFVPTATLPVSIA